MASEQDSFSEDENDSEMMSDDFFMQDSEEELDSCQDVRKRNGFQINGSQPHCPQEDFKVDVVPRTQPRKLFTNCRERWRQQNVSGAFAELRRLVPTHPPDKKLSKNEILRMSIRYIRLLCDVLERQKTNTSHQSNTINSIRIENIENLKSTPRGIGLCPSSPKVEFNNQNVCPTNTVLKQGNRSRARLKRNLEDNVVSLRDRDNCDFTNIANGYEKSPRLCNQEKIFDSRANCFFKYEEMKTSPFQMYSNSSFQKKSGNPSTESKNFVHDRNGNNLLMIAPIMDPGHSEIFLNRIDRSYNAEHSQAFSTKDIKVEIEECAERSQMQNISNHSGEKIIEDILENRMLQTKSTLSNIDVKKKGFSLK